MNDRVMTRREALASLAIVPSLFALRSSATASTAHRQCELARGRVYDAGTPDRGGIRGVLVSNGRDITVTDDAGCWTLPVQSGECVFVIKPAHWQIDTRHVLAGKFYYLHQPDGTPLTESISTHTVAPTGSLPLSIDFGLLRQEEPASFEVLLLADTQAANAQELDFVRTVLLAELPDRQATFAIHHGDAMGDDLSLLAPYSAILRETRLDWHHCPGNHDLNLDATDPCFALEAWKQHIGPAHYAFQFANATFILLNNVDYFGQGKSGPDGRAYRGNVGERQLTFVDNLLRHLPNEHLIVVSMHVPLVSFDNPDSAADTTADRRELMQLLSRFPHTVSFSGHSHTTEHHYLGRDYGFERDEPHHHHVLTAACGSWWSGPVDERGIPVSDSRDGSPKGFHILAIDGSNYETRFVPFLGADVSHMRSMIVEGRAPTQTPAEGSAGGRHLLVDVFDGGPKTLVTCEIDGQPWTALALTRSPLEDPYVADSFVRHSALCKPWVAAAHSSHIWIKDRPPEFQKPAQTLLIRVTGEYGQQVSSLHTT